MDIDKNDSNYTNNLLIKFSYAYILYFFKFSLPRVIPGGLNIINQITEK
ncbi:hypothetical protein DCCM_3346 [Desulfocucumis palustris]|uniref:Uncharacterized protein n=1 Tax=Desulfocucumis palustris TaxID=1898651 RepID=A0A2L2XDY4_9FIRM|nr:hypothetical protein DCCM_3346 [Desulfocucumis palustris]